MRKGQRPSIHKRTIRTKRGFMERLINPSISRKPKSYGNKPRSLKIIEITPSGKYPEVQWAPRKRRNPDHMPEGDEIWMPEDQRHFGMTPLPIYQIKGKQYFLDKRLGEYRNIKNPHDRKDFDEVSLDDLKSFGASPKWIQKANLKKGALSRQLGIKEEDNIPSTLLDRIVAAKAGDTIKNPTMSGKSKIKVTRKLERRAILARTLKGIGR
jgi:hypothetical protein